jgi:putative nucleotidyltransferase with HDIG domain
MENTPGPYYISIEHLAVGMYVHLDLRWVEHNFSLNSFKIKNVSQIAEIKALGLKKIRIDPDRSTTVSLPVHESASNVAIELPNKNIDAPNAEHHPVIQQRLAFLNQQRAALDQCERQFAKAATSLRSINANLETRPQEARQEASDLVQDIVKTILNDKDIAIHLMSDKADGEEMYFHALNVSVLAMMLAKEVGMPAYSIEQLGIGCLFHDIGKTKIPDRVLKVQAPTRAELNLLQQHCAYGSAIGVRLGLAREAMNVIMQHHECMDGTGYPHMLIGAEISPLARIAAIVNTYDNHCNQADPANSLTPYEALSHMYSNERAWFDAKYLNVFIHCMGVYPPGTLVRLSDETLGLVIASNFGKPLRPRVLIFDPSVPKEEAATLDLLREPDLSVKQSLRPRDVSRDVYEYLSPRTHMTYFFNGTPKPREN